MMRNDTISFGESCAFGSSTVGMPVPRPPPCRPGRAVVPHPVPRWSALPRCTAQPSGTHAPTWNVRQTRTRALDAVADAGPLLPRVTPPLASPPVAPWERPVHRPMEDAGERAGVPAHARVVVVAPSARRQTLEACPPRPLPGWWDPCRASLASGGERRAGGAPPDARPAVPLWWPAPRAAQPGAAPRRAGVPTAAPAQRGVRWCHVAVAGRPPVGPPPPPPCGVLRHAAGPPPVRSLAAPPGGSPTAWWHPVGPPEVQGLGPSDLGEDGRDRPALGPARLGMDALARGVHHPGLQPWAPPVEHGPVVAPPPVLAASPRAPSRPYGRAQVRARTASSAPRPARAPSRPSSTSGASMAVPRVAQASGPRGSARAGRPRGRAGPWACGRSPRRTTVARERGGGHRGPKASRGPCRWAAEGSAGPWSPPLAPSCVRSGQPSRTRAASTQRDRARNRGRWSAVAGGALPRRPGGCWSSGPTGSGSRGLGGRRPAVTAGPWSWAVPPAADAACSATPAAGGGLSR